MQRSRQFLTPFCVAALCLYMALAGIAPVSAQNASQGSMPSWTVPVLRLVSATHVEPTTGVVLSGTGLVLVPEDFASMGDEIIVLDGGIDIIRNGRPARIERKFAFQGVQVLFVDGLKRRGLSLATTPLKDGEEVTLIAFPPAEQIAEGKPPINIPVPVVVFGENGQPAFSSEIQLPNVTGPLLDRCGNMVGFSIADDIQSMEASAATQYRWRETLLSVYSEMQVTPREVNCSGEPAPPPEPEPAEEEPVAEELIIEEPVAEEPIAEESEPEDPVPEEEEPEEDEPEVPTPEPEEEQALEEELLIDVLPPIEKGDDVAPEEEEDPGPGSWLWLVAALILIGAGFVLHYLRKTGSKAGTDEPDSTASGPALSLEAEDEPASAPILLESLMYIRGVLSDGTDFEDSCAVSENAINVVIGRLGTDLTINSPAVSRQHVSLNGTSAELTVSDLGSSNGTSINGIPCLEGEIMFIEPGDTLILGDARCSIEIRPGSPADSGEQ